MKRNWHVWLLTPVQIAILLFGSAAMVAYGQPVELEHLGLNPGSIWLLGTMIFSLISGYRNWEQSKAIWDHRSGESVSVDQHLCFTFLFVLNIIYGLDKHEFALVFNGAIHVLTRLPILAGLRKYEGFNNRETAWLEVYAYCLLIVFLLQNPTHRLVFLGGMAFLGLYKFWDQPRKLKQTGKRGRVTLGVQHIGLCNCIIFSLYAFTHRDLLFCVVSPAYVVAYWITIKRWHKAQP